MSPSLLPKGGLLGLKPVWATEWLEQARRTGLRSMQTCGAMQGASAKIYMLSSKKDRKGLDKTPR